MIEKLFNFFLSDLKLLMEDVREVVTIEGSQNVKVRVDEPDILKLSDQAGNFLGPVLATGLNHPKRKPMEGDVEYMTTLTFEPRGEPNPLIVMLQQQHGVAKLCKIVCPG